MATLDYEAEYDNRRRVPESPEISARWREASETYRRHAHAELDCPYGPGDRQRYDLFFSNAANAPLLVYIHGGYWQWGDRRLYAFIAKVFNASGVDVVLPSYSLCPMVSVMNIVEELRTCLAVIWQRTGSYPLVAGHSAGGHLAAAMLATDWSQVADVPEDLVRFTASISGIFDLQPLTTTSINQALGLDRPSATAASPRFWAPPPADRTLLAIVGALESSEFKRQSRDIVQHWSSAGLRADYVEVPGQNHFSILDALTAPEGTLSRRLIDPASR
ncbi:MAG TPA: alpha/beta hydrolase [Actinomycetota bacterium]|nr:alpha/beta hydrolase [Actinomycetota bacterium]